MHQKSLDAIIRGRRTAKLLRSTDTRAAAPSPPTDADRATLRSMIDTAGFAPFHKRAHEATHRSGALDSPVPWRFHLLEYETCGALLERLRALSEANPGSKWSRAWGSKIPELLGATGALVQVTWLPDPPREPDAAVTPGAAASLPSDNDVEHIAAASASVQNLLLLAEDRGWSSYWSSGGILRDPEVFDLLGIGREQRLLGAILLSPPDAPHDRLVPGGLHDQRGVTNAWARVVQLR